MASMKILRFEGSVSKIYEMKLKFQRGHMQNKLRYELELLSPSITESSTLVKYPKYKILFRYEKFRSRQIGHYF